MKRSISFFLAIVVILFACPDSKAGTYEDAVNYYHSGNLDEAFSRFSSIVKDDPGNTQARFYLANTYALTGQHEKAIEEYRRCAKDSPGTIMEKVCLKAIEKHNDKLNASNKQKSPHSLMQMKSEMKMQKQASDYEKQLQLQCSIELNTLKKRYAEDIAVIDQQLSRDIRDIPRSAYTGNSSSSNSSYQKEVDRLKVPAEERKKFLEKRLKADSDLITERYNKRLSAYASSRDNLRSGLNSTNGNMQVVPHGTNMNVRNYINFGQEKVYEPPVSMRATTYSINEKVPILEVSRAELIRQTRQQFKNSQLNKPSE